MLKVPQLFVSAEDHMIHEQPYTHDWFKRYLSAVAPTGRVWHKEILRWARAQGRSSDAPGIPKNVSGPVGILLKRCASGARR